MYVYNLSTPDFFLLLNKHIPARNLDLDLVVIYHPVPAKHPLLGRVLQRNIIATKQHCSDLVQARRRQEPPQTRAIAAAPHERVELVHFPQPLRVRLGILAVPLQPPLRPEDVSVRAVDVAVARHDGRVEADDLASGDEAAVRKREAGFGDYATLGVSFLLF